MVSRLLLKYHVLSSTSRTRFSTAFWRRMTTSTSLEHNGVAEPLERVTVVGSGNWGSAIARIAAKNALANPSVFHPTVKMWVFEETFENRPLSELINETHINPKYLPDIPLGENVHCILSHELVVYAEPDLRQAIKGATALVVVLPHEFLGGVLERMKGAIEKNAKAVTLIKGIHVQGSKISTFASMIQKELGISCSALSGANIAHEVACDLFSESTLGVALPRFSLSSASSLRNGSNPLPELANYEEALQASPDAKLWKRLFHTPTFRIRVVGDVEAVCLCGALKNIVALAAGFVDGLGWGANAKAAIMRQGLIELHDFCLEFFPSTRSDTFLKESCGIADVITSCLGGRNRQIAEQMVKTGQSFQELEKTILNGQKLQGPQTAAEVHQFLLSMRQEQQVDRLSATGNVVYAGDQIDVRAKTDGVNGDLEVIMNRSRGERHGPGKYPLFEAVWRICYEGMAPEKLIAEL